MPVSKAHKALCVCRRMNNEPIVSFPFVILSGAKNLQILHRVQDDR